jgi:hypothetical protein
MVNLQEAKQPLPLPPGQLVEQAGGAYLARCSCGTYHVPMCIAEHAVCRSQFIGRVVRGARRAFLLTGTPLLSRPIEAWPQVRQALQAVQPKGRELGGVPK